eukprot:CAMPEP_0178905014 /NCGR_PEP_ID=MMETSP0786-20121207/6020_1 /TAXON_ID=186022 /ORGANISM="Thalassionema frauenfeldii, Strain CCMP 1798" /LENGTH=1011 /DNA_ID=CAMNT_0020576535 /DNA_START=88 /DNA_END=3120 /DNA_ORIENTATION=-
MHDEDIWLQKPAIKWDGDHLITLDDNDRSSYWNGLLIDVLAAENFSVHCCITFQTLIRTTSILIPCLISLLPKTSIASSEKSGLVAVPVAIAIPEGTHGYFVLVPMDPSEGKDRLTHMMKDARPSIVLCATKGSDWDKMASVIECCNMNDSAEGVERGLLRASATLVDFLDVVLHALCDGSNNIKHEDLTLVHTFFRSITKDGNFHKASRLSHIVYTSGTTGMPKGCCSSSHALCHYLLAKNEAHKIDISSAVFLASSLSFDPCLSDILSAFKAKATLCISPRNSLAQLPNVLEDLVVTHILCTPTLWGNTMARVSHFPTSLQVVALGGEPVSKSIRQVWKKLNPMNCKLFATYGVTEACVYQTMGLVSVDSTTPKNVSRGQCVGHSFAGMQFYIARECNGDKLTWLNRGKVGEVILSGKQLDGWSCYLHRDVLTAERFICLNEMFYYKTGDRGFISNDGNLCIMGRINGHDGMVKVNGIRIELGEVEVALIDGLTDIVDDKGVNLSVVDACLAVCRSSDGSDPGSSKQIHAYIVLSSTTCSELGLQWSDAICGVLISSGPILTLLQMRCLARLRAGVMPSAFVAIGQVPMSSTGKANRQSLPNVEDCIPLDELNGSRERSLITNYGAAGFMVGEVIKDIVNLQPCQYGLLTTDATFAMLGGDSLAATRLVRALYAKHNNVQDSRLIGGGQGTLQGPFAVNHLLRMQNLGDYVDWLDQNGVCGSHQTDKEDRKITLSQTMPDIDNLIDGADFRGYEALLKATTMNQSTIVTGLLDVGINPNADDHGSRLAKVSSRNERKKKFKSNPLHVACGKGNPVIVEKLISKGCKFNSPDACGNFPLHLIASGRNDPTASASISAEIDDFQRTECVQILLDAGAPISMKNGSKQTVLHAAARAGHCQMLKLLLNRWKLGLEDGTIKFYDDRHKGGKLDWMDRWFRTPVHWAVLNGKVDALRLLLEEGYSADPPRPSGRGAKKRSSVLIESPLEICDRLAKESQADMTVIRQLLLDALS